MQLSAQARTAGKIVLDTFHEEHCDSFHAKKCLQVRYYDNCGLLLKGVLAGKLGVITAAQIKLRSIVEGTKNAYDDF